MADEDESSSAPAGSWRGAVELSGSGSTPEELPLQLELQRENDEWRGWLDLPTQGAHKLPISQLIVGRLATDESSANELPNDKPQARQPATENAVGPEGGDLTFGLAGIPGAPRFEATWGPLAITGTFHQAGRSFPFRLVPISRSHPASEAGRPGAELSETEPRRPQRPRPPFPYETHEIRFGEVGARRAGLLTLPLTTSLPEQPGNTSEPRITSKLKSTSELRNTAWPKDAQPRRNAHPAVLLIPGSGLHDRDLTLFDHRPFELLADRLARAGIASLRLHDRGIGGSEGAKREATLEALAADAVEALRFLAGRNETDSRRLGLLGLSEGAWIAALAAGRFPAAAVVLLAPAGETGRQVFRRQLRRQLQAFGLLENQAESLLHRMTNTQALGQGAETLQGDLQGLLEDVDSEVRAPLLEALEPRLEEFTSPWFRSFLDHDPLPALRDLETPTLALLAELDFHAPAAIQEPLLRSALTGSGVQVLPDHNHLFQRAETGSPREYAQIEETFSEVALGHVLRWLKDSLPPD